MNRRNFFVRLVTAPIAAYAAWKATPEPPQLMFHPEAFSLVMRDLPPIVPDFPRRVDVLYGTAVWSPDYCCRVSDAYDDAGVFVE